MLKKEQEKTVEQIRSFSNSSFGDEDKIGVIKRLPEKGYTAEELLPLMRRLRAVEKDYQSGKGFGGIYCDEKELKKAINEAYADFSDSNALYPGLFPALKKFELEVRELIFSSLLRFKFVRRSLE